MKIGDINDRVFLRNNLVLVNHFDQEFFSVEAVLLYDEFLEVFHLKHSRTFEVAFIAIVLTFPRMISTSLQIRFVQMLLRMRKRIPLPKSVFVITHIIGLKILD